MVKNKFAQIVFQTVYCAFALIAFFSSLGLFKADYNENFYVYYTNLSNYICMAFMFVLLIKNLKSTNDSREDGLLNFAPTFNFMCVIMIVITCLVYNFLLAKDNTVVEYFTSLNNLLLHLILPVMFVLNWVLFYERGNLKWNYPLLATVIPLVYVIYILIRARIIGPDTGALLYPYFFLNVEKLGWGGFFGWIVILLIIFVAVGYVFYFFDNFKKLKLKFKKTDDKR